MGCWKGGGGGELGLDLARSALRRWVEQLGADDGRRDGLGGVDDLLDAGHAERHVHARHAREVKRLERHLRAGLSDGLRPHRAHRAPGLYAFGSVLAHAPVQKLAQTGTSSFFPFLSSRDINHRSFRLHDDSLDSGGMYR